MASANYAKIGPAFIRMVRPKKHLGQHFLRDHNIARKIVDALRWRGDVLEIGPGTGVLTQYLLQRPELHLTVAEVDKESVDHLRKNYPVLEGRIAGDFLGLDLEEMFPGPFAIIGNFPYNISSQIFFKVLEHRGRVKEVVGMVQKEVADRMAAPAGNKTYGILSVLLQAFYQVENLFRVAPSVFQPPPKVMSSVVRLTRHEREHLDCDEKLFFNVVKQVFRYRRKTLRNGLKGFNLPADYLASARFGVRAEQLTVGEFELLVSDIGKILTP
jgi:16S rRNA (adenine1518-N6/adenine1519-N6)-dimethyltransferase